jgi:hypothetical protein
MGASGVGLNTGVAGTLVWLGKTAEAVTMEVAVCAASSRSAWFISVMTSGGEEGLEAGKGLHCVSTTMLVITPTIERNKERLF